MSLKENSLEDTALRIPVPYWAVGLILMVIVDGVSFAYDGYQVTGNTLHDYDTLTRLAYLRGAIESHSLNHGFFARLNAPYGMVLHWTLPFNLYMIGLIKLFGWLITPGSAYQYAGYWAGTILRAVVGPAAYWAGRRILSPDGSLVASILVLLSPYLLVYAHRGSANHHALMFLETVLMFGLAVRLMADEGIDELNNPLTLTLSPRERGNQDGLALLAGAMAGLCLWTTFELVIVVAPLFAILFYLWIMQGETRLRSLLLACAAFAAVIGFALLADPPYGGIAAPVLDHVSMVFLSLASGMLLVVIGACLVKPKTKLKRASYFVVTGFIAGGVWLACYPFVIGGIQGTMDPYVAREWLSHILEVGPIKGRRMIAIFLGPAALAIVLVFLWQASRPQKLFALVGLVALCALGYLHFRFALYSAVIVPYFLATLYDKATASAGATATSYRRYANLLVTVLITACIGIETCIMIVHNAPKNVPGKDDDIDKNTCNPYLVKDPLNDTAFLGVGKSNPLIINDLNYAAALLYWTPVRLLAGNYHRDSQGIKDDYMFFDDPGDTAAKEIAKKRDADFVLLCGDNKSAAQTTLATRLEQGSPPPWLRLKPWPDNIVTDLILYKIDKTKLGK